MSQDHLLNRVAIVWYVVGILWYAVAIFWYEVSTLQRVMYIILVCLGYLVWYVTGVLWYVTGILCYVSFISFGTYWVSSL